MANKQPSFVDKFFAGENSLIVGGVPYYDVRSLAIGDSVFLATGGPNAQSIRLVRTAAGFSAQQIVGKKKIAVKIAKAGTAIRLIVPRTEQS